MNMKRFIWILVITTFILGFLGFRYADRMCREYLDTPLSVNVMKDHLSAMPEGANLPKGEWSYGIDISHHQPFVFWKNLKVYTDQNGRTVWKKKNAARELGIDYVIMKASEGETFRDWRFRHRWKKADKLTYKRGAYHFFRPGKDAEVQARNFISQVGDIGPEDFPPILDIEKTDGLSAETINRRALEWLQIIE
jgi:lysozyme